jgi:hypothetical protein
MHPSRFPQWQSSSRGMVSIRFAHARASNTFKCRSSFLVEDSRCWCPGYATPEAFDSDAVRALGKHADAVESDLRRRMSDGRRRAS